MAYLLAFEEPSSSRRWHFASLAVQANRMFVEDLQAVIRPIIVQYHLDEDIDLCKAHNPMPKTSKDTNEAGVQIIHRRFSMGSQPLVCRCEVDTEFSTGK